MISSCWTGVLPAYQLELEDERQLQRRCVYATGVSKPTTLKGPGPSTHVSVYTRCVHMPVDQSKERTSKGSGLDLQTF